LPQSLWVLKISHSLYHFCSPLLHFLELIYIQFPVRCPDRVSCSMERKFHGSESSLYGLFAPGNESAEERKGLESLGCTVWPQCMRVTRDCKRYRATGPHMAGVDVDVTLYPQAALWDIPPIRRPCVTAVRREVNRDTQGHLQNTQS